VPYTVRAESKLHSPRKPHPDLEVEMTFDTTSTTAREVVKAVVGTLSRGWQATLLPGRIILYKESKTYSAGSVIAVS
jgi:hypothetical protein